MRALITVLFPLPLAAADDSRILHALNRLSWGPRPGDVEKVRAMGAEKWIDLQLHEGRDLALTTDFRDVLGEIVRAKRGVADISSVFPGYSSAVRLEILP